MAGCTLRHPLVCGEGWRKNGRTADRGGAGRTEGAGRKDQGRPGGGPSPLPSWGHSSQGSFQPSPGLWLQQHRALVVLKALGTEHFPASKWVKQKLCRVSVGVIPQRNC